MVATTIQTQCGRITPGRSLEYQSLRVVPLLGPSSDTPDFDTLTVDNLGKILITEVSESGVVPTVRLRNGLGKRLLLIDGQELVGCKQNRILNVDVLVPAEREIDLPVSCVEQGRWGARSRSFDLGSSAHRSARAAKMKSVYDSLKREGSHHADQREVWEHVECLIDSSGSRSRTSAMSDAYEQRRADLDKIRHQLELPEDAVGYAVFDGEQFLGLDLFDRRATVTRSWTATINSYLLDWLAFRRPSEEPREPGVSVEQLLDRLAGERWEPFETPGDGEDLRFDSADLVGSALVYEDAVLHLQVFPKMSRGVR